MEHITIDNIGRNLVRLTAEEGWVLFNRLSGEVYTEAVVRQNQANGRNWQAIEHNRMDVSQS